MRISRKIRGKASGPCERVGATHTDEACVTGPFTRAARLALVVLPLLLLLTGCRTSRCEPLEADNRKKEIEIRELRERLEHSESVNNGLMRELYGAHGVMPSPGPMPPTSAKAPPELTAPVTGLKEVTLGRGTGGIDEDKLPGDEAIQVAFEPRDADNHVVKVPGTAHITVLEYKPGGTKVPIGSWEIPPDKLRPLWKPALMSSGYSVVLPWQKWPTTTKLRVVLRFVLSDGRVFEADKDVTIRPPKVPQQPMPAPPMPGGPVEEHGPGGADGELPLPTPRPTAAPPEASRRKPLFGSVMPAGFTNGGPAATLLAPEPRR